MKHVSVFRLKPEFRTEAVIRELTGLLNALPEQVDGITGYEIGVKPLEMPAGSPDGMVDFYDLIQIITFASPEACMAYPASMGHRTFLAASDGYMEKVIGIDYPEL